jgi:hypothetical protein
MIHPLVKHIRSLPNGWGIFLLALWEIAGKGWIDRATIAKAATNEIRNNSRHRMIATYLEREGLIENAFIPNGVNGGTCHVKITDKGVAWLQEGYKLTKEKQLCN